jgi:hypothetical protein
VQKELFFWFLSSGPLLLFDAAASMLEATAKAQQAFWQSKLDLDLIPMRLSHYEQRASVLLELLRVKVFCSMADWREYEDWLHYFIS